MSNLSDSLALLGARPASCNSVQDVVACLESGDCVGLLRNGRVEHIFHNCFSADTIRYIYVELGAVPEVLGQGGWPWQIEREGRNECCCIVRDFFKERKNLPASSTDMPRRYKFHLMPRDPYRVSTK